MNQFKYQFPLAVIKKEDLYDENIKNLVAKLLVLRKNTDAPYFEVRIPPAFNPLLIDKNEPNAIEIAKGWEADGVKTELV